jgi:SAM-dependent methyltransferase
MISTSQTFLPLLLPALSRPELTNAFEEQVRNFAEFGTRTVASVTRFGTVRGQSAEMLTCTNEFWTAKQRAANRLHEVSYRACFKPQLPRFFIERLSQPGDRVYDPFMGRGTTPIEAALLGRVPVACDINPLSILLTAPRLNPPETPEIQERLNSIPLTGHKEFPEELLTFYHPKTLGHVVALKEYLLDRQASGKLDDIDAWIRMVAINRLTGHSNGFFSVYTLPPNQAVSVKAQTKINRDRNQTPPERDLAKIILKKSRSLLSQCDGTLRAALRAVTKKAHLVTGDCRSTPEIASNSVALAVTSPPFLNVVDYAQDNWLRCWFAGIDPKAVRLTTPRDVGDWSQCMTSVFQELARVLKPGGHVAFEVGEVLGGTVRLEEHVLPCGQAAGLHPLLVLINDQEFTKTANCWGVSNGEAGTNTNRIVVFRK